MRQKEVILLRILPTTVVFCAFMVVTLISWSTTLSNNKIEQKKSLDNSTTSVSNYISQRVESYEDILRGGAGLFGTNQPVNEQVWENYFKSYEIQSRYPGIQSIGYTAIFPKSQLNSKIQEIKSQGRPDFKVYPESQQDVYSSIFYVEPRSVNNVNTIGYNMYSEETRKAAMDEARDNAMPIISDVVTLIQGKDTTDKQLGFLMFFPQYAPNSDISTVEGRRRAIRGFVFAPFRANDLISQIAAADSNEFGYTIYGAVGNNKQPIYESKNFQKINQSRDRQDIIKSIDLQGVKWQIEGVASPEIVSSNQRERSSMVLVGGILFSIFIATSIYILLSTRAKALAQKEEIGIQQAKDELLALASHQLRTPATGVKQYVGMLREGFAGPLTKTQKKLLDKAYASNERQLNTINEMLMVAKADAGHLSMKTETVNMKKLLKDVVDEQRSTISERDQKCTLKLPNNEVSAKVDGQYVRIAIENLLTNATKYTKRGGQIRVELTSTRQKISIKVRDNGVGVDEKDKDMLFKKFSRIQNELTSDVIGSGIGLYLTKQIIDSHNGSIIFESTPNKGSQVTLVIPRKPPQTLEKISQLSIRP